MIVYKAIDYKRSDDKFSWIGSNNRLIVTFLDYHNVRIYEIWSWPERTKRLVVLK
jgi:hypothetical protein